MTPAEVVAGADITLAMLSDPEACLAVATGARLPGRGAGRSPPLAAHAARPASSRAPANQLTCLPALVPARRPQRRGLSHGPGQGLRGRVDGGRGHRAAGGGQRVGGSRRGVAAAPRQLPHAVMSTQAHAPPPAPRRRQVADAVRGAGAAFLEAPVSGSKGPAEQGQLIFLTAGEQG